MSKLNLWRAKNVQKRVDSYEKRIGLIKIYLDRIEEVLKIDRLILQEYLNKLTREENIQFGFETGHIAEQEYLDMIGKKQTILKAKPQARVMNRFVLWLASLFNKKAERTLGKPKKICNILPDIPDERDFGYTAASNQIPSEFSLIDESKIEVKDQGSIGSCGAHAYASAFEIMTGSRGLFTSELFHYYVAREYEGHLTKDLGMQLRNGAKVLKDTGIALETFWPYNTSRWLMKPSFRAYVSARMLRIKAYYRVFSVEDMKYRLSNDFTPIVLGIKVYKPFLRLSEEEATIPTDKDDYTGGHAVTVIGYSDKKKALRILNSWGTGWGKRGFAWLPYEYVRNEMMDAWTIEPY